MKNKIRIIIIVMTILVLSFATFVKEAGSDEINQTEGEIGTATSTTFIAEEPEPVTPQTIVSGPFEWPGDLRRICSCESNGNPNQEPRHYDADGNVLKGKVNPLDTGMCQINLYYHADRAEQLGLDLYTPTGNFEYASMLYREQGSTPWNWSSSCWQN